MATDTFLNDCLMIINSSNCTKETIQLPHIAQYIRPVISQIARFIPTTLSRLIKSGRVRFSPLEKGLFGYHNELSLDIVVEKSFRDKEDTVGAAIVLFHETAHSIVKDEAFDEEIVSHYLESAFYKSLQLDKKFKNSNKIKNQELRTSMEKLYMAIHNGKIVEYLLQYDKYQKDLTINWIIKNKDNYGGWDKTNTKVKKLYIDCICQDYDKGKSNPKVMVSPSTYAKLLINLLESAKGNRTQFFEMMGHGSYRTISDIMKDVSNRDVFHKMIHEKLDTFRRQYHWDPR